MNEDPRNGIDIRITVSDGALSSLAALAEASSAREGYRLREEMERRELNYARDRDRDREVHAEAQSSGLLSYLLDEMRDQKELRTTLLTQIITIITEVAKSKLKKQQEAAPKVDEDLLDSPGSEPFVDAYPEGMNEDAPEDEPCETAPPTA